MTQADCGSRVTTCMPSNAKAHDRYNAKISAPPPPSKRATQANLAIADGVVQMVNQKLGGASAQTSAAHAVQWGWAVPLCWVNTRWRAMALGGPTPSPVQSPPHAHLAQVSQHQGADGKIGPAGKPRVG